MAEQPIEQEILALERRYWQALADGDLDAVLELTDDPCVVTGASGVGVIDHGAYTAMMANATWSIDDHRLGDDVEIRAFGDDTVVIAYTVHEELTVDDEHVAFDAADSSVWIRRDQGWRCALHTESILGDPFGRR